MGVHVNRVTPPEINGDAIGLLMMKCRLYSLAGGQD
jgi:hypothetical protein